MNAFADWLVQGAVGPAAVALPVNWAAAELSGAAKGWFRRFRRVDDLSRLVRAAAPAACDLAPAEFDALRRLLSDEQTWLLLGHATVNDLAVRVGDCIPSREGRSEADSRAAALSIARGLLEFAVANLEPKVFQQVVLARLQRMKNDQASVLDEAMFSLHADMIAGFADVMGELRRALDRMPPGPAQRGEIAVYLNTLIDRLNADPWPQDRRFGGPILTPATIERKLWMITAGRHGEEEDDADALGQRCMRLAILGGPGAGKTWLAKRIARQCAEKALKGLAAGETLDEIELPLYTTCSRLFTAHGDIRNAVVSSAFEQLGDMGASRLSAAVRMFFTDRSAPTLLVIDSLDEARGPDERLRQADTLPWRIILTSRPSSWNRQLVFEEDDRHRVGELRPLRYRADVEAFIKIWFQGQPEKGNALTAQISQRPSLQRSATIPLILAFYCILGSDAGLPESRRDLYAKVLKRMLTGRWRTSDNSQTDADRCLRTLQGWAWSGATSDQASGIGRWADDITTSTTRLRRADQQALDHIATPVGPSDIDTGMTPRRFIHRSIAEHLVAEHVASLTTAEAADELLPHIWYDADWEYSAPAAVAMHPQHNQLLRTLICRAATSDQIPVDISVIDGCWEFRRFLASLAAESSETDWSPDLADMIGRAVVELAKSGRTNDALGAVHWERSNLEVLDILLRRRSDWRQDRTRTRLATLVRQLAATAEPRDRAAASLELLANSGGPSTGNLIGPFVLLASTAGDKRWPLEALLSLLDLETDSEEAAHLACAVSRLKAATAEDKRRARTAILRVLGEQADGRYATGLADALIQLGPTPGEQHNARDAVLILLAGGPEHAAPTEEDKRRTRLAVRFFNHPPGRVTAAMISAVIRLAPTPEDRRQARGTLLRILAGETTSTVTEELVTGVIQLTTADARCLIRSELLDILSGQTDAKIADNLINGLTQLHPTADDNRQIRAAILSMLAGQNLYEVTGQVEGLLRLDATTADKRRAREVLVKMLADAEPYETTEDLISAIAALSATAIDIRQACDILLQKLASAGSSYGAEKLSRYISQLVSTADGRREACGMVLRLLEREGDAAVAVMLVDGLAELDAAADDRRLARELVLRLLEREGDAASAARLVGALARLDATADDRRLARELVLRLLEREGDAASAARLVGALARLDATADDRRLARELVLRLLERECNGAVAVMLVDGLAGLSATADDRRLARELVLRLLEHASDGDAAARLFGGLVTLGLTADDRRRAHGIVLRMLADQTDLWHAAALADVLLALDATEDDVRLALEALKRGLLAETTFINLGDPTLVDVLADFIAQLDDRQVGRTAILDLIANPSMSELTECLVTQLLEFKPRADDRRRGREIIIRNLAEVSFEWHGERLIHCLARLDPTVRDLSSWNAWRARPTGDLIAAVRENSGLTAWLAVLPSLAPLSS